MTSEILRDPGDTFPWSVLKDGTRVLQMRTAISGLITQNNEMGICMEGSTHLIHNPKGITRLKGQDDVTKALNKASGTRQNVTVIGYLVDGKCEYFGCMTLHQWLH
ncbi:hypothetical protein [Candidatus Nitrotoga arctica]|uniref:Uncharacterized protein n=1 Tax=Candidatus Nitrotoga arctica TaxID=453162 RepID=A0ABN8AS39_9PROT|nr:hypothetical protein [Candidatus Nitrotoga arctica]CAG9933160.1 protein of unknown function [Candidatus Nitrotoga arctica]